MSHVIEVFTGGCSLCEETVGIITVGKCKDCQLIIHDIKKSSGDSLQRMKDYDVRSVPTTIIDGKIKVVGAPNFPWFCSDEFYKFLEAKYPLTISIQKTNQ